MTQVIRDVDAMRAWRESARASVGFVPTMGALHAGHASLLAQAREGAEHVVLSVFVNRTQFDDAGDYARYPADFDADLALARAHGVDVLFAPNYAQMYPDNYQYAVSEKTFSRALCGAHRPGHFDGVLTVVMKLLHIVRPHTAWFGEKDHQQLTLIRGMADAFFLPTQIIGAPAVREADGLAMSSRNARLTPEQRALAPMLHQVLCSAPDARSARDTLTAAGFDVDYVEDRNQRRYAAARLGNVRLIDNVAL